jgi:hypothetical protein
MVCLYKYLYESNLPGGWENVRSRMCNSEGHGADDLLGTQLLAA